MSDEKDPYELCVDMASSQARSERDPWSPILQGAQSVTAHPFLTSAYPGPLRWETRGLPMRTHLCTLPRTQTLEGVGQPHDAPAHPGVPPTASGSIFAKPNTAQEEPSLGCGQRHGPRSPVSGPGPVSWSLWPSLGGLPGRRAQALGPSSGDLCQGAGVTLGGEAQASKVAAPQYFWITPNST